MIETEERTYSISLFNGLDWISHKGLSLEEYKINLNACKSQSLTFLTANILEDEE